MDSNAESTLNHAENDLYTVAKAAKELGVSTHAIQKRINRVNPEWPCLPAVQLEGKRFVSLRATFEHFTKFGTRRPRFLNLPGEDRRDQGDGIDGQAGEDRRDQGDGIDGQAGEDRRDQGDGIDGQAGEDRREKTAATTSAPEKPKTFEETGALLGVPGSWLRNWMKRFPHPIATVSLRGRTMLFPRVMYRAIKIEQGRSGIQVRDPYAPPASKTDPAKGKVESVGLRDLFRVPIIQPATAAPFFSTPTTSPKELAATAN